MTVSLSVNKYGLLPPLSLQTISLNLFLVNRWQLECQETTLGPRDTLLYFPNHIHRTAKVE